MDAGQDLFLTIDGLVDMLIDKHSFTVDMAQGVLASYLEIESFVRNLNEYAE